MMHAENADRVRRIRFWLDALRTPQELERLAEMKARLVAVRANSRP